MVGEIRDHETADIAIQSALTGHLVFTTVHANNVIDVLGRFLNMKIEPYNFVSALNCVMAQRLVRTICEHCKREVKASEELLVESGLDTRQYAAAHVLRGCGVSRVRRHRLQGPDRDLRTARRDRQHPRADPRAAPGLGDQARGEGRGHDVPARFRAAPGLRGNHHAPGNQQGHVRGGGLIAGSLRRFFLEPAGAEVALEFSSRRRGGRPGGVEAREGRTALAGERALERGLLRAYARGPGLCRPGRDPRRGQARPREDGRHAHGAGRDRGSRRGGAVPPLRAGRGPGRAQEAGRARRLPDAEAAAVCGAETCG